MTNKAKTLKKAEFNPKLKTYINIYGFFILLICLITIPLLPFWLIIAPIFIRKYFDRLECELTTRSLRFQKGLIVTTEKTIPLDKIQDLTFKEGPLLRFFGLSILKIETAGNSASAASDLSLIGIMDPYNFRQLVFDQRDKVTDNTTSSSTIETDTVIEVLKDIRTSLSKIESKISD